MEVQEFSHNTNFSHQQFHSHNNNMSSCSSEHFIVEEFFNFSNDDNLTLFTDSISGNSTDSYTSIHTNNSLSVSGHQNFKPDILYDTTDLCVPYDDLAELEWLSNFEEESLSNEDLQKMQLISGIKASNDAASKNREFQPQPQPKNPTSPVFDSPVSVPAKARSKGTRGPPCDWTSRLLVLSPTMPTSIPQPNHHVIFPPKKPMPRRRDSSDQGEGRRCLHCATDKTPQWRTGPMGPKTLCNACGVRYKSGRLVPEYRPAASPTFIMTRHSNSHRKVMELRRQKEMIQAQHHQFNQHHQNMSMMYDVSSNGDEYLIHQHVGPYFT